MKNSKFMLRIIKEIMEKLQKQKAIMIVTIIL